MDREIGGGYWIGAGRGGVTSCVAKGGAVAKKGNGIFLVFTDVDPQHEGELIAWYNTEHLGDVLKLPGFLDAAAYAATKGGPTDLSIIQ
jgi:hypothetical protein